MSNLDGFFDSVSANDIHRVVQYIESGINIDVYLEGETALISAVRGKKIEAANALIDAGADVNACDEEGMTALMYAAAICDLSLVRRLVNAGADVNAVNESDQVALREALNCCSIELYNYLSQRTYPHLRQRAEKSTLMVAASENIVDVLLFLSEIGVDLSSPFYEEDDMLYGWTALMCSSRSLHIACVESLIRLGVDIDLQNEQGETALILASESSSRLEARDNPKVVNKRVEIIRLLIEANANLDIQNNKGQTALMLSSYYGHPDIISLLVSANCDVKARDAIGKNAIDYAEETIAVLPVEKSHRNKIIKTLSERM